MRTKKSFYLLFIAFMLVLNFNGGAIAQTYPEMVTVAGGTFNMGGSEEFSKPIHKVTVSSFSMAKCPVTVAQYRAYCTANHVSMPETPEWGWNDNNPISDVSYDDAAAYCKWLSKIKGMHYRLPTEAEYEFAARGGNKSKGCTYSGSNNLDEVGWYHGNSGDKPHPVGQKKPNELGLCDMSGNMCEWCSDWYDGFYYSKSPTVNPKGPSPDSDPRHVLRGGCDVDHAEDCTVSARTYSIEVGTLTYGFRVVSSK
jgi:formylglycine-generating enzyme